MELLDAIIDIYVTCPNCENVFRVDKGNPRTSEQYRPSFMEDQEVVLAQLVEEWAKKVETARTHQRSIGVGTVLEKIAPIVPGYPLDLRDARFIGGIAPCDIMSLDGYAEKKLESITFIEVKTGKTMRLARMEREFKKVVDEGQVHYDILHYPVDELIEFMKDSPIKHKKGEHK